jgi:hypothetical protein
MPATLDEEETDYPDLWDEDPEHDPQCSCLECQEEAGDGHARACRCVECGGSGGQVHNYSFKPDPVFYGVGPVFTGFELEIDVRDANYTPASALVYRKCGDLAYLKVDGSVCGFEMVTHPMDYGYAIRNFPWALLETLAAKHGCTTPSSCGLHVHVNRAGFSNSLHEYRWLKFLYRNADPCQAIARRRNAGYASWSEDHRAMAKDITKMSSSAQRRRVWARSSAINTLPDHTYEVRMFASSLVPQEVQAALGLVHASVEYTRTLTAAQVAKENGWSWESFRAFVRANPQYAPLLAEMEVRTPCVS